jgi:hypothetical protein
MPNSRQPRTSAARALILALVGTSFAAASDSAAVNYVPNPGFESCGVIPTSWSEIATEDLKCETSMPGAGAASLSLSNDGSAMFVRAQSDCVVVPGGTLIQTFRFSYRTASPAVIQVALTANAYTGTDCTGGNGLVSAGAGASFLTPIATDGIWHTLPTVTAPVDGATNSIRFFATFQLSSATLATVFFDDLEFSSAASMSTSTSTSTSTSGATVTSTTGAAATSTTTVTPTSTTNAPPTTLPVSFSGTGPASSDCYVTFQGFAADTRGRADCTDGAACDADGAANGSCTFLVRVCVAQPLAGCTARTVTALKATPASATISLPSMPAVSPACGATTQIVVPLKRNGRRPGLKRLAFTAKSDGKPKRERDVIKLRCLPPASSAPP